jgi:hypothetical protein|tara:strand:+ start:931 stop:1167 length:237 start_codon:yes stop_codon:yes gene_type:complete
MQKDKDTPEEIVQFLKENLISSKASSERHCGIIHDYIKENVNSRFRQSKKRMKVLHDYLATRRNAKRQWGKCLEPIFR